VNGSDTLALEEETLVSLRSLGAGMIFLVADTALSRGASFAESET
jgi:hypothetical protein